jgi:Acyl-CoA thioesterase C-terminal domain/Acyl-CoA thioesterase N-terminal domain
MTGALFVADREGWLPTELSRGPWSSEALHGGPVAALLARLAEGAVTPDAMRPARITVELLRPVPLATLRGEARLLRPGRKVQWVGASLHEGERELARATVLWIRREALPPPEGHGGGHAARPPGPETVPATRPEWRSGGRAYHSHGVEHRVVRGAWGRPGPCTDWIRLRVPVVAGEAPSPLQRVAAAADFGNGISAALPLGAWRFVNPDLTIHLQRLPRGEWIGLDAVTWLEGQGIGLAESELFDEEGRLGRSLQSLLLEKG